MNIKVEEFTSIPKSPPKVRRVRTRVSLASQVREQLTRPGLKAIIPVERRNVDDTDQPEEFSKSVSRITSRLYAKNALNFPFSIRTEVDGPNTLTVYRLNDE